MLRDRPVCPNNHPIGMWDDYAGVCHHMAHRYDLYERVHDAVAEMGLIALIVSLSDVTDLTRRLQGQPHAS